MRLVGDEELERLAVVANCRMNRERGLTGVNSYAKDLGVELGERLRGSSGRWLDLCCGEGRALREARSLCSWELWGLDLVGAEPAEGVNFVTGSWHNFHPDVQFDLITCVHGLHYFGDKLGALEAVSGWLSAEGKFLGHLDLNNLKSSTGGSISRVVLKALRGAGYEYDRRRRLLRGSLGPGRRGPGRLGRGRLQFPLRFLGANPEAGPNYTGQPAVDSYYEVSE